MTKNRAAKLAARTIAADQDLRLPDGTVHNFADGALRPPTKNEDTHRLWVAHVMREAASKGWALLRHGGHEADEAAAAIEALHAAGPALILIDKTYWVELELSSFWGMAESAHPTLNLLISRLPRGCTVAPSPWESRHAPLDTGRRPAAAVPSAPESDLLKLRIVFARRYADMVDLGAHPAEALETVAGGMEEFDTGVSEAMASACRGAATSVRRGLMAEDVWGPHRPVLGAHLVQVIMVGHESGSAALGLRLAADTLEAELRLGFVS
jgi:hypothetical protein